MGGACSPGAGLPPAKDREDGWVGGASPAVFRGSSVLTSSKVCLSEEACAEPLAGSILGRREGCGLSRGPPGSEGAGGCQPAVLPAGPLDGELNDSLHPSHSPPLCWTDLLLQAGLGRWFPGTFLHKGKLRRWRDVGRTTSSVTAVGLAVRYLDPLPFVLALPFTSPSPSAVTWTGLGGSPGGVAHTLICGLLVTRLCSGQDGSARVHLQL